MRIVKTILNDEGLFKMWKSEFMKVQNRIKENRQLLRDHLVKLGAKGQWDNITKACGMFVLFPLNQYQVKFLREKHHLYTIDIGRINISSIDKKDIERIAKGIKDAMETVQQ